MMESYAFHGTLYSFIYLYFSLFSQYAIFLLSLVKSEKSSTDTETIQEKTVCRKQRKTDRKATKSFAQ